MIKAAFEVEIHGEKNIDAVNGYRDALKKEILLICQILQDLDLNHEYKPVAHDSGTLAYNYENQHIFEPSKGMLGWAVEKLKNLLRNLLILTLGKQSKSYRFSLEGDGGCITRTNCWATNSER